MDQTQVLSPDCPYCGQPPYGWVSETQAMCGNDDCLCLFWNPLITPAQNRANASEIQTERGGEGANPDPS